MSEKYKIELLLTVTSEVIETEESIADWAAALVVGFVKDAASDVGTVEVGAVTKLGAEEKAAAQELPPFGKHLECPKCRGSLESPSYDKEQRHLDCTVDEEHLHWKCACGYVHLTQCYKPTPAAKRLEALENLARAAAFAVRRDTANSASLRARVRELEELDGGEPTT